MFLRKLVRLVLETDQTDWSRDIVKTLFTNLGGTPSGVMELGLS